VCILVGVLAVLAGPGSCALSCVTAPLAVADAMKACNAGATEDCLDRFENAELATTFGEGLPTTTERCGTAPAFETREVFVEIDGILDMKAEVGGHLTAGDCQFPESSVHLRGSPLRWRIVDIAAR